MKVSGRGGLRGSVGENGGKIGSEGFLSPYGGAGGGGFGLGRGRNASRPVGGSNENGARRTGYGFLGEKQMSPRAKGNRRPFEPLNGSLRSSTNSRGDVDNLFRSTGASSCSSREEDSVGISFPPIENARAGRPGPRASIQPPVNLLSGIGVKPISLPRARSSAFQFNGGTALYAVNTTNGLIRSYNEDRVSIVINIKRKADWRHKRWPNCSFFSVFDGHGGSACADYLMENLHRFVLEHPAFPEDVPRALTEGFSQAESEFCKFALRQTNVEKSGSCALALVLVDNRAYVGNVGDCRVVLSERKGKNAISLSKDHKPEETSEQERIVKAGGTVSKNGNINIKMLPPSILARLADLPFRLYPGGLSVSRSFGDITAKDPQFGGNPGVLIAKPDISVYKIEPDTDFIILCCDGVFDKFTTKKLCETVTRFVDERKETVGTERKLALCENTVDFVLSESMKRLSYDNLTSIFININAF